MSDKGKTGYPYDLAGVAHQALQAARDLEYYLTELEERGKGRHSRQTKELLEFYTTQSLEVIQRLTTD